MRDATHQHLFTLDMLLVCSHCSPQAEGTYFYMKLLQQWAEATSRSHFRDTPHGYTSECSYKAGPGAKEDKGDAQPTASSSPLTLL